MFFVSFVTDLNFLLRESALTAVTKKKRLVAIWILSKYQNNCIFYKIFDERIIFCCIFASSNKQKQLTIKTTTIMKASKLVKGRAYQYKDELRRKSFTIEFINHSKRGFSFRNVNAPVRFFFSESDVINKITEL